MDLSKFKSELSWQNKVVRLVWHVVWLIFFRPFPRVGFAWRRVLLRLFGADVGAGVRVYGTARIYYPPHLKLADHAVLGDHVICYNVAPVVLGTSAMVSQYAHLCAASHDFTAEHMPLVTKPIHIAARAWICADAFVGPGVTVQEGAVVGARAVVFRDVLAWQVVAGNPATVMKTREVDEVPEANS